MRAIAIIISSIRYMRATSGRVLFISLVIFRIDFANYANMHEHIRNVFRDRSFFMSMGGLVGFRGGATRKKMALKGGTTKKN